MKERYKDMTYLMQNMSYPLEAIIESDGESFHIIYGKHKGGYYLVIPNFNVGCEMSNYKDIVWNKEAISRMGINKKQSLTIAKRIKELCERFCEYEINC